MRETEIERTVTRLRNTIDSNNREIKKLRNQLDELTYTKKKLNDSQNKLYDYHSTQRQTYQRMRSNYPNNRFAVKFSEGMLNCFNGSKSANAHENIAVSIQKVARKTSETESRIQELNSENRRCRNRISDLEYELEQMERMGED